MHYTIRNIRPSVLLIPDAGLRLDAGQTAVVGTLSPQMAALLAHRVLEVVARDPLPPTPVEETPAPPVASTPVEESPVVPEMTEPPAPVATEKKTRKSGATTAAAEQPDEAQ
ncbi:MAG TPA: hypothetical protein VGM23_02015 [Armatimonadota bacterium]|jgi:hypothetical protein